MTRRLRNKRAALHRKTTGNNFKKATHGSPSCSFAVRLKSHPFFIGLEVLAVCAGLISVAFAAQALREAAEEAKLNRMVSYATLEEIEQTRIDSAWQNLATRVPGNSGKVRALEYLASQGVPLNGIDLSCRAMGGEVLTGLADGATNPTTRCQRPTRLNELFKGMERRGPFQTQDAPVIWLSNANLSGVSLFFANLSYVELGRANLSNSTLWGADFGYANLWFADLSNSELTGTDFTNSLNLESTNWANTWAKVSSPPLGIIDGLFPEWACTDQFTTINGRAVPENAADFELSGCVPWKNRNELQ
ncbi:MAG: pentapeptide repeat-containing protein [Rhodobacteraceae bacterium]|nr:pentapeptide repeat-containing protein [Paracoccaceae bacterium]